MASSCKFARTLAAVTTLMSVPVFAQVTGETEESEATPSQGPVSRAVLKTATAIDNFFSTEEYDWQANETRVNVRGNLDWVDEHGTEFKPKVKLRLALPALSKRVRLIINNDDDASNDVAAGEDESNLALRYILESARQWGVNFDLGVSTRGEPTLQGFGRVNAFRHFSLGDSKWGMRAANRLYWYTESHWRNDFRWYVERVIKNDLFFRSRTRFDYQEDKNNNILPEQRFTLYHHINDWTALAYDAIVEEEYFTDTAFDEDEFLDNCEKCLQYQLRLRLRRNIKKFPRFFYEIWAAAAWSEQRNYHFTPAIHFQLEVVFGDSPKSTKFRN